MSTTKSKPFVQPYLFFNGRCEEALEFYRRALGAHVLMLMRFKDSPEPPQPGVCAPGFEDKVCHASFRVGKTFLMASDGRGGDSPAFHNFSLVLNVSTEAEAGQFFAALAEGGQVQMPLAKTFYSPSFGMVTDQFGVAWMIMVPQEETD